MSEYIRRERDETNVRSRTEAKQEGRSRLQSLHRRVNMCNLDTVLARGGSSAFLLKNDAAETAVCGKENYMKREDEAERRLRAIWSRKLAMHLSLHNRKLDAEKDRVRVGGGEVGRRGKRRRQDEVSVCVALAT